MRFRRLTPFLVIFAVGVVYIAILFLLESTLLAPLPPSSAVLASRNHNEKIGGGQLVTQGEGRNTEHQSSSVAPQKQLQSTATVAPRPTATEAPTTADPRPLTAQRYPTAARMTTTPGMSSTEDGNLLVVERRENHLTKNLLNGVILFLHGGRWESYFVRECLPRLQLFLLRCMPYPVHIFHEGGIKLVERSQIETAIPAASTIAYEDVSRFWKKLPNNVAEAELSTWMRAGVQVKFQGRGYRLMCRFWAGVVWTLPSLDTFEYYWRLDTDSILTKPPKLDPFLFLNSRNCAYGYNRLKGENPHVLTRLYDTYWSWARERKNFTVAKEKLVREFFESKETGEYWGAMFYNNFEMGTMRLKRSEEYQSLFRHLDEQQPMGMLRYRWGDAPIHTLGVVTVLAGRALEGDARRVYDAEVGGGKEAMQELMCNVTQEFVGYRHAVTKMPPLPSLGDLPKCATAD